MSRADIKRPGLFRRIGNFFASAYSELRKVNWPTRAQLMNHTWVVIAICAIFTVIVFVFDTVFITLLNLLSGLG